MAGEGGPQPSFFHIPPGARDDRRNDHGRRLAVLDRSGAARSRTWSPAVRTAASSPQAPLRQPRALPGRQPSRGSGRSSVSRPGEPVRGIDAVKMGTTVATNALLERNGDRTLLVVNQGFRDALRIGYQTRPRLFDLRIVLPEMLYERVVEVDARVGAGGEVIAPLDAARAETELRAAFADGIRSVAIVLIARLPLPGARARARAPRARGRLYPGLDELRDEPAHEARRARRHHRGSTPISRLSFAATSTGSRRSSAGGVRLMFMQSNGGLTDARRFQGKDAILSGPAGGIVGAVETAARAGRERIISFDMGGTSTDVAHYDGAYERAFETLVAGGAHARADDDDPHRGGGRRLDPLLRRRALPGRPRVGRRGPGAGLLPAGRPPLGHRLQRPPRQAPARVLSAGVRTRAGRTPRPRGGGGRVRGARGGDRGKPGGRGRGPAGPVRGRGRGRVPAHRGRQHGERDQVHLGAPRLRRDRLHPQLLRRSGRPARLPRRGRPRHDPGHDPPVRGRSLRLRDGARRRAGAPRPGGGSPPRRGGGGGARPGPRRAGGRGARGARRPGDRRGAHPGPSPRPRPVTTGRTPPTSWRRGARPR